MILPYSCLILQRSNEMPEDAEVSARLEDRRAELCALIERYTRGRDGVYPLPIDADQPAALYLYHASTPGPATFGVYAPCVCLIARGAKRVLLGAEAFTYDPGHYLLGSVDLPVIGQITRATPHAPHLALRLDLDPAAITAAAAELPDAEYPEACGPLKDQRGMAVGRLDLELLDAVVRLVRLLGERGNGGAAARAALAPLMTREIIYRLLTGAQGARLRRIAGENSAVQRVARAIAWLKEHYAEPVRVADLAREAHMSPSGLHHHFKAVTALTPVQFQKRLRLQEARRLMLDEGLDAANAAFQVGYESASQFSREYRRLFAAPPRRDINALLRSGAGQEATPPLPRVPVLSP